MLLGADVIESLQGDVLFSKKRAFFTRGDVRFSLPLVMPEYVHKSTAFREYPFHENPKEVKSMSIVESMEVNHLSQICIAEQCGAWVDAAALAYTGDDGLHEVLRLN